MGKNDIKKICLKDQKRKTTKNKMNIPGLKLDHGLFVKQTDSCYQCKNLLMNLNELDCNMNILPKSILNKILVGLSQEDIINFSLTSKDMCKRVLLNDDFWKVRILNLFGPVVFSKPKDLTHLNYCKLLIGRTKIYDFVIAQFDKEYWDEDKWFCNKVKSYGFGTYQAFVDQQKYIIDKMSTQDIKFYNAFITSHKPSLYIDHSYDIIDIVGFFFVEIDCKHKLIFKSVGVW